MTKFFQKDISTQWRHFKMGKREYVTKSGDTFEWEETEEVRKAVEKLHKTISELEAKAPDYGVGK